MTIYCDNISSTPSQTLVKIQKFTPLEKAIDQTNCPVKKSLKKKKEATSAVFPNKTSLRTWLSDLMLIHYVPTGIRCTRLLYQFNQLIGWSSSQLLGAAILCLRWARDLTDEDQPLCVLDITKCTVVTCILGVTVGNPWHYPYHSQF